MNVDTTFEQGVHLTLGTTVTAVLFNQGRPSTAQCKVVSEAPLFLETEEASVENLTFPRPTIVLWQDEGKLMKGEATIVARHDGENSSVLELRNVMWEDLERRKFPRYAITVPCMLRAVEEVGGTTTINVFPGTTEDISAGGAWIRSEGQIEVGSLVEFQACVAPGEFVRALAVVPHRDTTRQGFGLSFLDFVGSSNRSLHDFLQRAA